MKGKRVFPQYNYYWALLSIWILFHNERSIHQSQTWSHNNAFLTFKSVNRTHFTWSMLFLFHIPQNMSWGVLFKNIPVKVSTSFSNQLSSRHLNWTAKSPYSILLLLLIFLTGHFTSRCSSVVGLITKWSHKEGCFCEKSTLLQEFGITVYYSI